MDYSQYPRPVLEDIVRLRRQMDRLKLPRKLVDRNVLVGTWNIRAFGSVYPRWDENPGSPKRNLRAMAYIAEIIRRFDVRHSGSQRGSVGTAAPHGLAGARLGLHRHRSDGRLGRQHRAAGLRLRSAAGAAVGPGRRNRPAADRQRQSR